MGTTTNQNLSPWMGLVATGAPSTTAKDNSPSAFAELKRRHFRSYLLQFFSAMAVSGAVHVSLFVFSGHKTVQAPPAAPARVQIEKFVIPVMEPEEAPSEVLDTSDSSAPIAEFAPPSLDELISVPIQTDFTMQPSLPLDVGTKVDANMLAIPQHAAKGLAKLSEVFMPAQLDRTPVVINKANPVYPIELVHSQLQGTVVIQFIVDEQGAVISPRIISSPHPAFSDSVLRCLGRWRFKPGMKAGKAVRTQMELPVGFSLQG